jgi:ribonuclease Z
MIDVALLGTGGMMPLPGRFLASMMCRVNGRQFLFDCGEGTQVALRRLNLKWKKIDAIFISHTHADHVTGLPGMLMLSSQVDRDEPLYVIGPPKIKEYIETSRKALDMYINYEIIIIEIDPNTPQMVFEGEGFKVFSFPLKHTKPCVGYSLVEEKRPGSFHPEKAQALGIPQGPLWGRLQQGESVDYNGQTISSDMVVGPKRLGRKVSFVTDTLYHEAIASYTINSDLLICEAMFGAGEEMALQAIEKRHMTAYQTGLVGVSSQAKKLGLIHYSPRYIDRELPELLAETHKNYPQAFLCRDRMVIDIPYPD